VARLTADVVSLRAQLARAVQPEPSPAPNLSEHREERRRAYSPNFGAVFERGLRSGISSPGPAPMSSLSVSPESHAGGLLTGLQATHIADTATVVSVDSPPMQGVRRFTSDALSGVALVEVQPRMEAASPAAP
jgi:hypothetical protein